MKSTNIWDTIIVILFVIYWLSAFGGTAFLVTNFGWSAWWMIFPALAMNIRFSFGGKK